MALDKLVDSAQLDADLTAVADAIREKGSISEPLSFPEGMVEAIGNLSGGDLPEPNIIEQYDEYGNFMVRFSGEIPCVRDYQFYLCYGLAEVTLCDGMESIGLHAFEECSIFSIEIPDSVYMIWDGAFYHCRYLEDVTLPAGLMYIGTEAFYGCGSLECIAVPEGTEEIGEYAFYECDSLTDVTLPDTLTYLGINAFNGCSSLTGIVIPNNLEYIPEGAFAYCSSLASITIPDSVAIIEDQAFCECSSLVITELPSTIAEVRYQAFYRCTGIVNLEIACSYLGEGALMYCTGLQKVWFRDSCTDVPASGSSGTQEPFSGCAASLQIYVEADSKPDGYGPYFNRAGRNGATLTVVYGQATRPW